MVLAYSPELEEEVKAAINKGGWQTIDAIYFKIFGKSVKRSCNDCYNEATARLIQWKKDKPMGSNNCKYRFTRAWEKKKVVVTIGGTSVVVTAETLSIATAEAILNSGKYREGIVELNPNYNGVDVKKNLIAQPEPQPLSSISSEAKTDGTELKENVSEKESNTGESKPLTVGKKKREKG